MRRSLRVEELVRRVLTAPTTEPLQTRSSRRSWNASLTLRAQCSPASALNHGPAAGTLDLAFALIPPIAHFFDTVVGGDETGAHKPHPCCSRSLGATQPHEGLLTRWCTRPTTRVR